MEQPEEVKQEVEKIWKQKISGSPSYIWETKLKTTRVRVKDWAKANYKEPQREKEELQQELAKIQEEMENKDNTTESQAK